MWDIPSSTILAIMPECLPVEAPKALQKEAMALSDAVTSHHDKVAVIDVGGIITPYPNILSMLFGGTNIASIEAQFMAAMEDPEISGILFRVDSPGGLITGVEELASTIAAARGRKPIVAYAYGNAASAAYWIASAADQIVAGPTTMLGSIGVAVAVPKTEKAAGSNLSHPTRRINGWILKAMKAAAQSRHGLMHWKPSLSAQSLPTAMFLKKKSYQNSG